MSEMLAGISVLDVSRGAGAVCADILRSFGASCDAVDDWGDAPKVEIVIGGTEWRISPEELCARNPELIVVSISPFGRRGPYAEYEANELIVSAMGGTLRACGYPDRAPVKEAGDACWFHANAMAAAGALFALNQRDEGGGGQIVDVSVHEVAASRMTNGILAWQFDERLLERAGPAINYGVASVRCIWALADGYVFHSLMTGRFGAPANKALSDWMDERGVDNPMRDVDWLTYDRSALPTDTRVTWEGAISAFFATLTKTEISSEGRRRGINATCANDPADVLQDAHLNARNFFGAREMNGHTVLAPSRYVRAVAPNARGAPTVKSRAREDRGGPLAGVRVLDFSWALVGSFTTKALGDFGAQVVKVESSNRPCLSRIDVQTSVSKRGNFDDKPWFAHLNTSKLGVRLNLKSPDAAEIVSRLVDWADVIVENFSPGTMKSLGLDYEALSARKPELIMVSGSVYGQTGPLAQEWGVDGTGGALSGRLAMTGWPDRMPIAPSGVPYGDVVMPPIMAAAAVAAIHARRKTGQGRHIDASMYEVCTQQMTPALIAEQLGLFPRRDGNRDRRVLHQGVYPTVGKDRWIAIAVYDEEMWERFEMASGITRSSHESNAPDELDRRIAAWTAGSEAHELAARLQASGVAAGVVQDAGELVRDPQLQARGFLVDLDHPVLGRFAHQATPISLSRGRRPMSPAPKLGEHTEWICRQLLGMSEDEFSACAAAEVFM